MFQPNYGPEPETAMIVTQELSKYYKHLVALEGLTLKVQPGEIFGLLGPNGAGKTTTIKILTTLARPSRGWARIQGYDVVRQPLEVKRLIGVCPQEVNLDKEMTAYENLSIYGKLYRVPDLKPRIREMLALGELSARARDLVKDFSGGMQRRLLILRALMSRPRLLFLDEPTVGLDPQVRRQLWDLIGQLRAEGITIMLTTHYIEEAEILCDRVGILSRGRLIALDTPQALTAQIGGYVLESLNNGRRQYLLVKDKEEAYLQARGQEAGVIIRQTNLEDVFIQLTGERLQAGD
ncbi:MAG: ATP-binding cassette domain-containing protein [Desulfobacca sp.]|nr:ATP-binding cassette domain-containing protein [Desulfobacca sp.]